MPDNQFKYKYFHSFNGQHEGYNELLLNGDTHFATGKPKVSQALHNHLFCFTRCERSWNTGTKWKDESFQGDKYTFLGICICTIVSLCMSVSVSVLSILWQSCLSARSPVFMSFCQFILVPSLTFGQGSCHSGWPWSIVSSSWNQTQVYSHHVELIIVTTWVKSLNNVYIIGAASRCRFL